jgi:hypothetical protein
LKEIIFIQEFDKAPYDIRIYYLKDENEYRSINIKSNPKENENNWYIEEVFDVSDVSNDDELLIKVVNDINRGRLKDLKKKKDFKLKRFNTKPGEYYPRIYRPIFKGYISEHISLSTSSPWGSLSDEQIHDFRQRIIPYYDYIPDDSASFISSVNQISILIESLRRIFQTIQPDIEHYDVYGHSLRNLLILACTEAETQMKGILRDNNIQKLGAYFNTNDYVALKLILRLDQFSIKMKTYPMLDIFSPFSQWDIEDPTKSLTWYDCYNKVKHDREKDFSKATLKNVIDSISAVVILMIAQYGEDLPYWKENVGKYFDIIEKPDWDIQEYYTPPFKDEEWKPIDYTI